MSVLASPGIVSCSRACPGSRLRPTPPIIASLTSGLGSLLLGTGTGSHGLRTSPEGQGQWLLEDNDKYSESEEESEEEGKDSEMDSVAPSSTCLLIYPCRLELADKPSKNLTDSKEKEVPHGVRLIMAGRLGDHR